MRAGLNPLWDGFLGNAAFAVAKRTHIPTGITPDTLAQLPTPKSPAGRCVNCGECERACPMDIPLGAINQKMAQLMEESFDFQSGLSSEQKAPFTTFNVDDPETGIL